MLVGLCSIAIVPFLLFCFLRWVVVGHFGLVSFGGMNIIGIAGQFLTEDMIPKLPETVQPLAVRVLATRAERVATFFDVCHLPAPAGGRSEGVMAAEACLDAGLLVGTEDSVERVEPLPLPVALVQVQHHGGPGEDAEIGIELVVGLGCILEEEAMADGLPADIALEQHALGRMERDPAGHGFVDDRILDEGAGRHLAGHMEMDGIVAELAALAQVHELDALDLDLLEALPEDRMSAELAIATVRDSP